MFAADTRPELEGRTLETPMIELPDKALGRTSNMSELPHAAERGLGELPTGREQPWPAELNPRLHDGTSGVLVIPGSQPRADEYQDTRAYQDTEIYYTFTTGTQQGEHTG